jgi:hypothetical protein
MSSNLPALIKSRGPQLPALLGRVRVRERAL